MRVQNQNIRFDIYYCIPEFFGHFYDKEPKLSELPLTHTFLRSIDAPGREYVFEMMQAENWSPNGEARSLIEERGLAHTSMSVGDVVCNRETGEYFVVAAIGFKKLEN